MIDNKFFSRRTFLQKLSTIGCLGLGSMLAGGCGAEGGKATEQTTAASSASSDDPCLDVSDLTSSQRQVRGNAGYVKETPDKQTRCDNCQFWLTPDKDKPCGECVVVPGPIHAGGYCDSWAPQVNAG